MKIGESMKIGMSHGAGGEIMQGLISDIILGNKKNKSVNGGVGLEALDDGATIPLGEYETRDKHRQPYHRSIILPRRRYWPDIHGRYS